MISHTNPSEVYRRACADHPLPAGLTYHLAALLNNRAALYNNVIERNQPVLTVPSFVSPEEEAAHVPLYMRGSSKQQQSDTP
eukprot:XP_001693920.1 predicted protein [Chlamydomonas reinhardtii]